MGFPFQMVLQIFTLTVEIFQKINIRWHRKLEQEIHVRYSLNPLHTLFFGHNK